MGIYHIRQNVHGENFCALSLNCEYFPANHAFVDRQYIYRKKPFSTQNVKVSPVDVFMYTVQSAHPAKFQISYK